MTCTLVKLPTGETAIVCGTTRRRRCACVAPATLLCDWKMPEKRKRGATCDRPICAGCTTSPATDKDLCPEHARAWDAWKAARA